MQRIAGNNHGKALHQNCPELSPPQPMKRLARADKGREAVKKPFLPSDVMAEVHICGQRTTLSSADQGLVLISVPPGLVLIRDAGGGSANSDDGSARSELAQIDQTD